ncbi:MAG: ThiF family adenylyltransferase [Chloroflexi bacterium]|nr:ThiF family adenylyltransferase [Chloroflexota bacterium]
MLDPNRFDEVFRQAEDLGLVSQPRRVDATEFGGVAALEGEVDVEGRRATLCLVLDTGFPLKLPRFFLRPPDVLGLLPHVDRKGTVCFSDSEGIVLDRRNPLQIIEEAFERAMAVLADGVAGRNRADFGAEIEAYWRDITGVETACSMLNPGDEACRLVVAIGQIEENRRLYIARDEGDLAAYCNGKPLNGTFTLQRGLFLPLESGTPLIPPPSIGPFWTVEEARRILLGGLSDANRRRLRKLIKRRARIKEYVVASLPHPSGGAALFGFRFDNPGKRHPLAEGKAEGQVRPLRLLRRDRSYLVERGGGDAGLTRKRVLLAGCGAVGGHLAFELARAGVLDITLVDPDMLAPENSFRHVLGRRHWGQFKAQALKHEIEADLPYTRVACHTVTIEQAVLDRAINLADYDLIVLALGNPTIELQINEHLHEIQKGPPLLVTWVEPLGIGGHTLLTGETHDGGCFECLYTQTDGEASFVENRAAFAAPGQSFGRDISGCGTLYTPYGSADAVRTAVMATRLAIDALTGRELGSPLLSWKGDPDAFQAAGFRLAPRFSLSESALAETQYAYRNIGCRVCSPEVRQQP